MLMLKRLATLCTAATITLTALAAPSHAQLDKVKTVWVIMMENHNWIGNNAGASFGDPDIKGNKLAPLYQQHADQNVGVRQCVL